LKLRGISREVKKNWVKFYSVISPEKLVEIHENKLHKLKNSLPSFLQEIYPQMSRSGVWLYEGISRVKKIYKDAICSKSEILHIVWAWLVDNSIYHYLCGEYQKERLESKKYTRLIYNKRNGSYLCTKLWRKSKTYRKVLGVDYFVGDSMSSILIYGGNKVALVGSVGSDISGVVLTNINFYNTLTGLFEMVRGMFGKEIQNA